MPNSLFKRWIARIGWGLVGVVLAGCGGEPSGDSTSGSTSLPDIVIGSHTDHSGPTAIWGVGTTNAARMRIDEINAAGGIHGRKIRYVVEDTQYQVPRAIQGANKLINRDNVFALLLSVGTPTNNAVMPLAFEQGVPNLFPISGARSMGEPFHPLKFLQRGIYYDEARAAVKYFVEQKNKEHLCVVYQDTEYGQEILEAAEDQAKVMGIEIQQTAAHKPTESEFTAAILRLRSANCDLVLMGTIFRDTILFLDAARKMDYTGVDWVGTNATFSQVIADAPSGDGYYAFTHMTRLYAEDQMSPRVRAWWDAYSKAYGEEPGLAAMEGYRATDIMIQALDKAGPELTRESFLAALESMSNYDDMFGYDVGFSATKHNGATGSTLSQVQDGRWVALDQAITF